MVKPAKWSDLLRTIASDQPHRVKFVDHYAEPSGPHCQSSSCVDHITLKGMPEPIHVTRLLPTAEENDDAMDTRDHAAAFVQWAASLLCRSDPPYALLDMRDEVGGMQCFRNDRWLDVEDEEPRIHAYTAQHVKDMTILRHIYTMKPPHQLTTFTGRIVTHKCSRPGQPDFECEILVEDVFDCPCELFHPEFLHRLLSDQAEPMLISLERKPSTRRAPRGPVRRNSDTTIFKLSTYPLYIRTNLDIVCTYSSSDMATRHLLGAYNADEVSTLPLGLCWPPREGWECPFIMFFDKYPYYEIRSATTLLFETVQLEFVAHHCDPGEQETQSWLDTPSHADALRYIPKKPTTVNGITALYLRLFSTVWRPTQDRLYGYESNGELRILQTIASDFRNSPHLAAAVPYVFAKNMIQHGLVYACRHEDDVQLGEVKACRDLLVAYCTIFARDKFTRDKGGPPIKLMLDECFKLLDQALVTPIVDRQLMPEMEVFECDSVTFLARRIAIVYATVVALHTDEFQRTQKKRLALKLVAATLESTAESAAVAAGVVGSIYGVPFAKDAVQLTIGNGTKFLASLLSAKLREKEERLQKAVLDIITDFGYCLEEARRRKIDRFPKDRPAPKDQEYLHFIKTALLDFSVLVNDDGVESVESTMRRFFEKRDTDYIRLEAQAEPTQRLGYAGSPATSRVNVTPPPTGATANVTTVTGSNRNSQTAQKKKKSPKAEGNKSDSEDTGSDDQALPTKPTPQQRRRNRRRRRRPTP